MTLPCQMQNSNDISAEEMNQLRKQYQLNGFCMIKDLFSHDVISNIRSELQLIISGDFPTGKAPDKVPTPPKTTKQKRTVQQYVNIWKASEAFKQVVHSRVLSKIIHQLNIFDEDFSSVTVAQDQLWMKPPNSYPLTFHRDTPYLQFIPQKVVTAWIPLHNIDEAQGPIEYIKGSHLWEGDSRNGSMKNFFDKGKLRESKDKVIMKNMKVGDVAIHNGNTWHGSGKNISDTVRIGLGVHFIPGKANFHQDATKSKIWSKYCIDDSGKFQEKLNPTIFKIFKFK
eukprot:snap_masked-scaffold_77-processed-gene-0.31-mRNA-1 protein AED:0.16 eAED:0.18 QI:0/-1/0/1/-1/1/1/0/282